MRQLKLYIATSLDGYIATADGSVEWLDAYQSDEEDYGYHRFYDSVDTLLMGGNTYRAILVPGQTISQGTEFVCITTDDNTTYTYTLDKAITTESNTIYALTLKLHKGEIELTSDGLSISPWGTTNTIDGDADMDIQ